jgi:catechol 2,3-dioxygenase-like lactoylglutathione lyase family enzyme
MQQKPRFGFALEYVDDIDAAKHFYADVLGLVIEREAPQFIQFTNFAIASDESLSGTRQLELYWIVDDAEAAYRELSPKAEIASPVKQMPFGKVFSVKGPTGEPRYLIEFAARRPSVSVR